MTAVLTLVASPALLARGYLAAPTDIPSGKGPEWGKAAPIGLLIILLLGIAVFFLVKSMNRNLKRVPPSFDPDELARLEVASAAEVSAAEAAAAEAAGRADPDSRHYLDLRPVDDEPLDPEPEEAAPTGGAPGGQSER